MLISKENSGAIFQLAIIQFSQLLIAAQQRR